MGFPLGCLTMPLIDFQSAMGRLIRTSNASDPLRSLTLDEREASCIAALKRSAGYHFTLGVQRSWCLRRATGAVYQTLSILPAELSRRLINEWVDSGNGTSSFVAVEADALLEFMAKRLPDPSHEMTVCRFEQATIRANEGRFAFIAPQIAALDSPDRMIRRGRYAGLAEFYGEPHLIVAALFHQRPFPPLSSTVEATLLFGPGLEELCRPASPDEVVLWESLMMPMDVSSLLREGHHKGHVESLLLAGILEFC